MPGVFSHQLWLMDPDGSNQTRLTNNVVVDGAADFSPDGSKIAFERTGRQFIGGANIKSDIFVMNSDGSDETNITNHPRQDTNPLWSLDTPL